MSINVNLKAGRKFKSTPLGFDIIIKITKGLFVSIILIFLAILNSLFGKNTKKISMKFNGGVIS